jgi:hypothetical protein
MTSLDAFADGQNIKQVDFMKIDVEGAEERVVRGAERLLSRSPGARLLIELYEPSAVQCGCSVSGLIAFLGGMGFMLHSIDARGQSRPATEESLTGRSGLFVRRERTAGL